MVAETSVGLDVSSENEASGISSDLIFNSGNEIIMEGFFTACAERTVKLTLTIQSAVWSGGIDGFWPSRKISMDLSSKKSDGPAVTVDVGDENCFFEDTSSPLKAIRKAGLKIPLGTNAGPCVRDKLGTRFSIAFKLTQSHPKSEAVLRTYG